MVVVIMYWLVVSEPQHLWERSARHQAVKSHSLSLAGFHVFWYFLEDGAGVSFKYPTLVLGSLLALLSAPETPDQGHYKVITQTTFTS